jgi:hypothetical protein
MNKLICACIVILLSLSYAKAQEMSDKILTDALNAQGLKFPGIGLRTLSKEGDQHVFMSKNGRYVIKGELHDMWSGVDSYFLHKGKFSSFPDFINKKDTSIQIGNVNGTPVDVFVSYACKTCEVFIKQITQPAFLDKYYLNVFIVYTNEITEKIAKDVYCSDDKIKSFYTRFVDRNINGLANDCKVFEPKLNVGYASIIPIRSLPALMANVNEVHFGPLPAEFKL